jgi:precorrin-3B C17-methyltransferase
MNGGRLALVGIGPGNPEWITPEAAKVLAHATDLVGYCAYLERLPLRDCQIRHSSDNRKELTRARQALSLAAEGRAVAVVSGGDPGVFAMAAAVFEAIETNRPVWDDVQVTIIPGITAMQVAAARIGAPLGHDFCAISLSDNLKPWAVIERRLTAAAEADFVIAIYNPASKARPDRIHDAFARLRRTRAGTTPVVFARAIGRKEERIEITTLAEADPSMADMATLVIIGSSETRLIARQAPARPYVYTPRSYGARR